MLMGNNKLKSYVASGAIQPRRFVKFGTTDTQVVQATAADGAVVFGISDVIGANDTARCDVFVADYADVEFGGTVTRGQAVTSDAQGRAVAAGAGAQSCARAMVSAVAGDIGAVKIERGVAP